MSAAAPNATDSKPAVCPVNHGKGGGASAAIPVAPAAAGVCPVNHGESKQAEQPQQPVCPVRHPGAAGGHSSDALLRKRGAASEEEPEDTGRDRSLDFMMRAAGVKAHHNDRAAPEAVEDEYVPTTSIPSAGLGNSEDGKEWLNPSAGELYRSMKRKNKEIEQGDANSVAAVHEAVTWMSWKLIEEYENLHQCKNPTLARFQGMYGIPTIKSRLMTMIGGKGLVPFDRHDWMVDRCGKEVRYILDYYSVEEPADPLDGPDAEPDIAYYIDVRPAPTLSGIYDRLRVSWNRWRRGESVW